MKTQLLSLQFNGIGFFLLWTEPALEWFLSSNFDSSSPFLRCFKMWRCCYLKPAFFFDPLRLRRYRIRAGSTSDSDLLTCLAQLMHGSRGSPLHYRSSAQHEGSRSGICSLMTSPHHHRSSSVSPRSSSSLQRSVSSSPSRHEHRGGCLGRSRSPPSFSGSPPPRRFYPHHLETCCSRQARTGPLHLSRGKGCSREGKCSSKLSR